MQLVRKSLMLKSRCRCHRYAAQPPVASIYTTGYMSAMLEDSLYLFVPVCLSSLCYTSAELIMADQVEEIIEVEKRNLLLNEPRLRVPPQQQQQHEDPTPQQPQFFPVPGFQQHQQVQRRNTFLEMNIPATT